MIMLHFARGGNVNVQDSPNFFFFFCKCFFWNRTSDLPCEAPVLLPNAPSRVSEKKRELKCAFYSFRPLVRGGFRALSARPFDAPFRRALSARHRFVALPAHRFRGMSVFRAVRALFAAMWGGLPVRPPQGVGAPSPPLCVGVGARALRPKRRDVPHSPHGECAEGL